MQNKKWRQVETIFHTALGLGGDERISYLSEKCSHDKALLSEIESLISAYENESEFLEEPAFGLGMNVLGQGTDKDLTGEKIGFYEIGKKLGGGGMGDVYLAEDTKLNRKIALKFLKGDFGDDKWAKRQFINEAQAVAMLEHPNICAVHNIEEIDEHNFIAMQFVEGETLAQFISERELSLGEILSIAHQLVSAVAAAHLHGIIHRDIKPGNIMITPDGSVKVLDFGLAKIVEKKQKAGLTEEHSHVSQNGLILGTVSYMSPEQLRAEKLDFRSDIFGVGIVLYEMLTKTSPFTRASQAETIAAILGEEPASIKEIGMPIPETLGFIVEKCLKKDREQRFQSAAEILVELDKVDTSGEIIPKRVNEFFAKFALVIAASLVVGLIFIYFLSAGFGAKTSVAVLPISFENPPADKEYLADGLTKSIMDELSDLPDLKVKNEYFTARYKGKEIDPQTAGKDLNAYVVLTGSIAQRDNDLILTTQLTRTSDGFVLDTNESKIDEANLIALQENIAERIISKIKTKLTSEDKNNLAKKDTESSQAKDLYLRGRHFLKKRKDGDSVNKAIAAFTDAKDIDQNFAKAWAGLADAYLAQSAPGVRKAITPRQAFELAKRAANRAIELDDASCESYNSLGLISYRYDWNWQEAEKNFRSAISINPEFLPAHFGLLNALKMQQRYDEAIEEANKIKEIDPVSVSADIQIALVNYRKYDFDQTDRILSDLLQRFPDDPAVKYVRVYQFLKTGRFEEAAAMLEPLYQSDKEEDKVLAAAPLGFAYARMGNRDKALKIIDDLEKFRKNDFVPAQEKALIYVGLGNYDKVFENLNWSCEERFASLPGWINDPVVDDVKSDPRFADIRKCANL